MVIYTSTFFICFFEGQDEGFGLWLHWVSCSFFFMFSFFTNAFETILRMVFTIGFCEARFFSLNPIFDSFCTVQIKSLLFFQNIIFVRYDAGLGGKVGTFILSQKLDEKFTYFEIKILDVGVSGMWRYNTCSVSFFSFRFNAYVDFVSWMGK